MTNRVTALSGVQKESCGNSQDLFSSGSQLHWCSSRRDPMPNLAEHPFRLQGMSPVVPTAGTSESRSTGYPSPVGAQHREQPRLCPISYTTSLQRHFLSISKFFRGFSGCQSAATTLRRKPPVGRMLISAGRQEGGAQLGSQSKSSQETTAPPALPLSCQEPRRAWQERALRPPCAPSPSHKHHAAHGLEQGARSSKPPAAETPLS